MQTRLKVLADPLCGASGSLCLVPADPLCLQQLIFFCGASFTSGYPAFDALHTNRFPVFGSTSCTLGPVFCNAPCISLYSFFCDAITPLLVLARLLLLVEFEASILSLIGRCRNFCLFILLVDDEISK